MSHDASLLFAYVLLNRGLYVGLHVEARLERWLQRRGGASGAIAADKLHERGDATNQWIYMLGRTCVWVLSTEVLLVSPLAPPFAPGMQVLGVLLLVGGVSLRLYAIRSLGAQWAFYVRPPSQPLVASGPYRWLAHPSYWGNVWWLGLCLALRGWLTGVLVTLLLAGFTHARLRKERAVLAAHDPRRRM